MPLPHLAPPARTAVAFALALLLLAALSARAAAESPWRTVQSSSYGDPFYSTDRQGHPTGKRTAWGWHCVPWDEESEYSVVVRGGPHGGGSQHVAHQWLPLGSFIEVELQRADTGSYITRVVMVADRGPYAWWGDSSGLDIQEPLVRALGYSDAYAWGVRTHRYRLRDDLGLYCPQRGQYVTRPLTGPVYRIDPLGGISVAR